MQAISLPAMRNFLSRSLATSEVHNVQDHLGELDFREYLSQIGFDDCMSPGAWIVRRRGPDVLTKSVALLFPETIFPVRDYRPERELPNLTYGLHTICATFHQSGIAGFFCAATVSRDDDVSSLEWHAVQLGLPSEQPYQPLIQALEPMDFVVRKRNYNYLRYHTDTTSIPDVAIPEEFSKEHLRVAFNTHYVVEPSDIDGIFWGQQHTYPIEIKEKTPAPSGDLGPFFGLDVGPFVKLAFYAAKRGNLHSLYVVREIDNPQDRNLVQWWFIKFDELAQFASWVPQSGGPGMGGGRSSVVRVPKCEFRPLTAEALSGL